MQFEMLRIAAALSFLGVATYYDLFNRKNVPVVIPYSMMLFGLILNLASLDINLILSSCGVALVVLAIGYPIYKVGQIGGADVLILAGIALLLPDAPPALLPQAPAQPFFSYPFILPVFIVSGFLAVLGFSAEYIPRTLSSALRGGVEVKAQSVLSSALIVVAYITVVYLFLQAGILSAAQSAFLLILVLLAGFLTLFKDHISSTMVEWVPLKEIDEEDVIALHMLDPKIVSRLRLQPVLTHSEMEKLKKTRLKRFPVFKGMPPFLPYVLLAVVLLLAFGDPIALLFT